MHRGTRRCDGPYRRSVPWHSATPDRSVWFPHDPTAGLRSSREQSVFFCRHTAHAVWSSGRLSFFRYGAEQPLFCQAAGSPVSLKTRGVNHGLSGSAPRYQAAEYAIKDAHPRPTEEAVAEGLVRSIDLRGVPPSHAVFDNVDYSADDTAVIDATPEKIQSHGCHRCLPARRHVGAGHAPQASTFH